MGNGLAARTRSGALIAAIGQNGNPGAIQSSTNGSAFTYEANQPVGSNPAGNPNPQAPIQVLAKRDAGGWSYEDLSPPNSTALETHFGEEYDLFSADLSQALLVSLSESRLSPEATENTPYLRDNSSGSYLPLLTASNVPPGHDLRPSGLARVVGKIGSYRCDSEFLARDHCISLCADEDSDRTSR